MKNLFTLVLLLSFFRVLSQNTDENRMHFASDLEKSILYETQQPLTVANGSTVINKIASVTFQPDADNDGMPDAWETTYGLNVNDATDAWADNDNDKVVNLFEYEMNGNPTSNATPITINVPAGSNINNAISTAGTGAVLRVEAGTYLVNYSTFSPKTVMIQGGWNSTFTSRDPYATPTLFDGQNTSWVLYFSFSSGISNVVVDGINIINGQEFLGAFTFVTQGGAVSNLCLKDCSILNSLSTFNFGGVAHIQHWDNSSSEVFIVKTLISNDSSSAVYNQTTGTATAKWHIINSTFAHNHSIDLDEGYGLRGFTSATATLTIDIANSIIWGNQLAALSFDQNGGPITIQADYSDIDSLDFLNAVTYSSGAGMINTNPLFVNQLSDYHLTNGSPCIDAGISVGLPYAGTAPDMGVYEDGLTSLENINNQLNDIAIAPNPVESLLTIYFPESLVSATSLTILNGFGKKLYERVVNENKPKIDVSSFSPGIYFIIAAGKEGRIAKKFIRN